MALKAAVELAGYWFAKGKEISAKDVTVVAANFADWLVGSPTGRMAKQAAEELDAKPAPGDDAEEGRWESIAEDSSPEETR